MYMQPSWAPGSSLWVSYCMCMSILNETALIHCYITHLSKLLKTSKLPLLIFSCDLYPENQREQSWTLSLCVAGFTVRAGSYLRFQREKPQINKLASPQKDIWQRQYLSVVAACSGLIVVCCKTTQRQHQQSFQSPQWIKPALSAAAARQCLCYISSL